MNCFGCVQEVRWRSCGSEGGCDFACDDAAFADAGDDDTAVARDRLEQMVDCLSKGSEHRRVETGGEFVEGGGLDADELRWTRGVRRDVGITGHSGRTMSMLAEVRVGCMFLDTAWAAAGSRCNS